MMMMWWQEVCSLLSRSLRGEDPLMLARARRRRFLALRQQGQQGQQGKKGKAEQGDGRGGHAEVGQEVDLMQFAAPDDGLEPELFDVEDPDAEFVALRRYNQCFRAAILKQVRRHDDPWLPYLCVQFAMKGSVYIDGKADQLSQLVLVSALFVGLSLTLFMNPEDSYPSNPWAAHAFLLAMGVASQLFVTGLIAAIFLHRVFTRPLTAVDTMCDFLKYFDLMAGIAVSTSFGAYATMVGAVLSAFDKSALDGTLLLSHFVPSLVLVFWLSTSVTTKLYETQFDAVVRFESLYLQPSGHLKPEFLAIVNATIKKESLVSLIERRRNGDMFNKHGDKDKARHRRGSRMRAETRDDDHKERDDLAGILPRGMGQDVRDDDDRRRDDNDDEENDEDSAAIVYIRPTRTRSKQELTRFNI